MQDVGLYGDCTDIMTDAIRNMLGMRNAMWLDKSKHTGAMGMPWFTATGWTAIATDLDLGRTSECQVRRAVRAVCRPYAASLAYAHTQHAPLTRSLASGLRRCSSTCRTTSDCATTRACPRCAHTCPT
mmetsp:Transcript_21601/g.55575  ORF Transcript_21601/g.55575 Transcript_21601/m.55575 type:complete len:128 (+) Transcript_21601:675-1058(+)